MDFVFLGGGILDVKIILRTLLCYLEFHPHFGGGGKGGSKARQTSGDPLNFAMAAVTMCVAHLLKQLSVLGINHSMCQSVPLTFFVNTARLYSHM